jgi:hypothetical protein
MVVAAAEGSHNQLAGAIYHVILCGSRIFWGQGLQKGNAALRTYRHRQMGSFDFKTLPIQKYGIF